MAQPAAPADVIREVIGRACGKPVHDWDTLFTDLHLDAADRTELLVTLELALRCEAGDIQLTQDLTVGDLIEVLRNRAA